MPALTYPRLAELPSSTLRKEKEKENVFMIIYIYIYIYISMILMMQEYEQDINTQQKEFETKKNY